MRARDVVGKRILRVLLSAPEIPVGGGPPRRRVEGFVLEGGVCVTLHAIEAEGDVIADASAEVVDPEAAAALREQNRALGRFFDRHVLAPMFRGRRVGSMITPPQRFRRHAWRRVQSGVVGVKVGGAASIVCYRCELSQAAPQPWGPCPGAKPKGGGR